MIFNGDEMLFFALGVISTLVVLGIRTWNKQYQFENKVWPVIIFGFFMLLFCIAWSVSSVLEGEPRAASMGMLVFGLPALMLLALSRRWILKKGVQSEMLN